MSTEGLNSANGNQSVSLAQLDIYFCGETGYHTSIRLFDCKYDITPRLADSSHESSKLVEGGSTPPRGAKSQKV